MVRSSNFQGLGGPEKSFSGISEGFIWLYRVRGLRSGFRIIGLKVGTPQHGSKP